MPPGTEVQLSECPDLETKEGRDLAAWIKKNCEYRKRIGEALWIARTSRCDCIAAVNKLSTVANNPGLSHVKLTEYLIQYLHHTRHLGIVYDYGTSKDNFRSSEGSLFKNSGGPIAWSCGFQRNLVMSSTEGEYYGLTTAAMKAMKLIGMCEELGIYSDEPFLLYEDNLAAKKMSENTADSKRTTHLERRAHFIRSKVNDGTIQLEYCPTQLMEADMLSKIMPKPGFEKLRSRVGLTYEHSTELTPRLKDSNPSSQR